MNNSLLLGQYYPEQSLLHRLDPRIKIICLLSYFIALFLAKDKLTCILVSLFAILAILFSRIPLRSFLHTFRYIFQGEVKYKYLPYIRFLLKYK